METDERRLWRQYVLDVLRPEKEPTKPSRRALVADVVLAIVLTSVAVAAVAKFPGGNHPLDIQLPHLVEPWQLQPSSPPGIGMQPPSPPEPPSPPQPPSPPEPPSPPQPSVVPYVDPQNYEPPLLLVALTALPLAVRRRYPLAAFWAVVSAALLTADAATWITVLTCAIAAYTAVAHGRNRVLAVAGLMLAAVLAGAAFRDVAPGLPSWLGPFVVLLSAGVAASLVRFWQQRLNASRRRLAELQQDQEETMRRAVQEERSRIAGELHDVVTHNVSVMLIQAGAARKMMQTEPKRSEQALLAVEASGRAAMAELRHVMGLLAGPDGERPGNPGDGLEPQPGLDQLDSLVERVRAAGTPVTLSVSSPGPLPAGVDLTAYRVVQEALTNTIKHAAGAAASVVIGHDGDWLEIEVTDTGGAAETRSRTGNGRGLIGLRERLAVYGGTLDAGPRTGGGYRIKARIPWRDA
ncbi:sensor histidine kinase [Streptosporangium sp. NPDC000396]|uniref:sensor histidine kinase n=1 Tax=Streptosporangium sp. NPDC000396 TaxID=3366185 RepID=UPI00367DE308